MNSPPVLPADSMGLRLEKMDTIDRFESPPVDLTEILKEEDETEFNYIQEISDLRAKLEEMDKVNKDLNDEIASKNEELEQCNNRIAKLEGKNKRLSIYDHRDALALI